MAAEPMNCFARSIGAGVLATALVQGVPAWGQELPEYRLKAAFLYNFIAFTELTLPGFHVHQIVGNFLMNGERDGQKGIGAEPAVHG